MVRISRDRVVNARKANEVAREGWHLAPPTITNVITEE
jgi:hypothetical protein